MQNEHAGDFAVRRKFFGTVMCSFAALHRKGRKGSEQFDGCRLPARPPHDSWTRATKHQIRTLTSRKAGQPIDSPMFTIPVPA